MNVNVCATSKQVMEYLSRIRLLHLGQYFLLVHFHYALAQGSRLHYLVCIVISDGKIIKFLYLILFQRRAEEEYITVWRRWIKKYNFFLSSESSTPTLRKVESSTFNKLKSDNNK